MTAPLHLTVAPGDDAPIYRQIVRQVRDAIAGGTLQVGDRLPSQRELAQRLVVAPLTVKKAYDELERDGLIRTARGRGTFVDAELRPGDRAGRLEGLREHARRLVREALLSRVEVEELVELVRSEDARLRAEREAQGERA